MWNSSGFNKEDQEILNYILKFFALLEVNFLHEYKNINCLIRYVASCIFHFELVFNFSYYKISCMYLKLMKLYPSQHGLTFDTYF